MIKKINKIDNIVSFTFFNWDEMNPYHDANTNDPIDVFNKNNVIFAENGNGKSVLVDIFKSLNGQDIELKKSWYRAETDGQKIKITLENNTEIDFNGLTWSNRSLKNQFLIFDKHFIEKFVHSIGTNYTDTPHRRQQRGRNIVYLGNFAKYNNEIDRINNLKNAINEKNHTFLETEQAKIDGILSKYGITSDELIQKRNKIQKLNKKDFKTKKDKLIKNQIELGKIDRSLKEKSKISALSLLLEVKDTFSLETEFDELGEKKKITINPNELLSFTIAKGVQKTINKIISKKDFIKQGLALLTDKTTDCPFCEQKIKNGEYIQIIKNYQEIFNEHFASEEQKVHTLLLKYRDLLEGLRDLQVPSSNQVNLNQAKQFITIDDELPILTIAKREKVLTNNEINLVLQKEKKILDKISGSSIDQIKTIIENAKTLIKNYNDITKKINTKIVQLKKDSLEGKLVIRKKEIDSKCTQLEEGIFLIENKDNFKKYFETIDINNKNKKVIDSLERIFQILKDRIVEEFNKFVSDYFESISSFVKEISPAMEILDIIGQVTYDRRSSRDPAQCGFCVQYNGKDCSGSLSEGERQVIALSFFFAQLKKDTNKTKLIVLDDPITSFDAGKRKSTAEVIQRETTDFEQLFISTCDPLFRTYCLKQIDKRNFYYIFKTRGSSSIHYVPKKKETIYSSFEDEFKDIEDIQGTNENVVVYGQKLRFCLETKIKEEYFGYSEDNLSSMIEKVTSRKEDFKKLFNNKDTILQIYKYCNTGGLAHYPKDGATSWNELKDKIKQYLDLDL